jgi:hypothetical protein
MENIELRIASKLMETLESKIANKIDMNIMEFITLIMEEVEFDRSLKKGCDKKEKVIDIINEFLTNDNNIFIKNNNVAIINNLANLNSNNMISDIIENIIKCSSGAVKINNAIKSSCFCF